MEFYQYKLNLSYHIINSFRLYNKDNWKQMINKIIPDSFNDVFGQENVNKMNNCFRVKIKFDKDAIIKSKEYINFIQSVHSLKVEYNKVISNYRQNGNIIWNNNYLKNIKPLAKNTINNLITKYPVLAIAKTLIDNKEANEEFTTYETFGHGRLYIMTAQKIIIFINKYNLENYNIDFYYPINEEKIYISKNKYSPAFANNMVKTIEFFFQVNNTNIGFPTINPVIDKFEIIGMHNNINLKFVYPNGEKQTDERFGLLLKIMQKSKADESQVTMKSSREEKLNNEEIKRVASKAAGQGYLKNGTNSNGKNIIKYIPKIIKKIFK